MMFIIFIFDEYDNVKLSCFMKYLVRFVVCVLFLVSYTRYICSLGFGSVSGCLIELGFVSLISDAIRLMKRYGCLSYFSRNPECTMMDTL